MSGISHGYRSPIRTGQSRYDDVEILSVPAVLKDAIRFRSSSPLYHSPTMPADDGTFTMCCLWDRCSQSRPLLLLDRQDVRTSVGTAMTIEANISIGAGIHIDAGDEHVMSQMTDPATPAHHCVTIGKWLYLLKTAC